MSFIFDKKIVLSIIWDNCSSKDTQNFHQWQKNSNNPAYSC